MINCLVLFDIENQYEEIMSLQNWFPEFHFITIGYLIKDSSNENILTLIDNNRISRVIFLIGESSVYLNSSFKTDAEEIISLNVTIICFNTNKNLAIDEDYCPRFLWSVGAIHMPFTKNDVVFTLKNVRDDTRKNDKTGSYYLRPNFPYEDPIGY